MANAAALLVLGHKKTHWAGTKPAFLVVYSLPQRRPPV